jgi:hypothetical protein
MGENGQICLQFVHFQIASYPIFENLFRL